MRIVKLLVQSLILVAAAADDAGAAASLSIEVTIGDISHFDEQILPTATTYAAEPGEEISMGYKITNTGDVLLDRHQLTDSNAGTLLNNFPYNLAPGAHAFFIPKQTITEAGEITGTWVGTNMGTQEQAMAADTVTVTLKQISLAVSFTVGDITHFDDQVRPVATTYTAKKGESISLSYTLHNTGEVRLTRHNLVDSVAGPVLTDFPYNLVPGAEAFIIKSFVMNESATFTAALTCETGTGWETDTAEASVHVAVLHSADQDGNFVISLEELLRIIQFYNSPGLRCDALGEDGFNPGVGDQTCPAHACDYNPTDWFIGLGELLRLIQFYNSGGFNICEGGEDGYCALD